MATPKGNQESDTEIQSLHQFPVEPKKKKKICREIPKEPATLFQNRSRKIVYDAKWLNHQSVQLNIDTINLILEYPLVWEDPRSEFCKYQKDSTIGLQDYPWRPPFISSSSFIQHTPTDHLVDVGLCWSWGQRGGQTWTPLLMSQCHPLMLAALTSSLERITQKASWENRWASNKEVCCDQHIRGAEYMSRLWGCVTMGKPLCYRFLI